AAEAQAAEAQAVEALEAMEAREKKVLKVQKVKNINQLKTDTFKVSVFFVYFFENKLKNFRDKRLYFKK
ncbi:hypothetical protein, partial [Neobacillus drentensis]|uniref:hypothetical protein n=1 Tax=Neobacillus drentensis TaxID=220684 RepID=UPI002FFF5F86